MNFFEYGPLGQPILFAQPKQVVSAFTLSEVIPALSQIEALRAQGAWVAGYMTYEAGYAFEPKLQILAPGSYGRPLLQFGIYSQPSSPSATAAFVAKAEKEAKDVAITPVRPGVSYAQYEHAIDRVLAYIAAGDCYQVNLTFPLESNLLRGTHQGLYGALRGQGRKAHGGFVAFDGSPTLISASPELFFKLDNLGKITTRPMKGTRPRGQNAQQDQALVDDLLHSTKDRAENLMIVDLLRNDISRLCDFGSVVVPQLFHIEHYPTVHQMVSTIEGKLAAPAQLDTLMSALFPCGSITGAPKIRAMQIIQELEFAPRYAYCGTMGWMCPDGSADFAVAIRTLSVCDSTITANVGGGVVQDSIAKGEWDEALWKARFMAVIQENRGSDE